jgi:hypothetical protein
MLKAQTSRSLPPVAMFEMQKTLLYALLNAPRFTQVLIV